MKEYLNRQKGMMKKISFTEVEIEDMKNLWETSESGRLRAERSEAKLEGELERAIQSAKRSCSEKEAAEEKLKRTDQRLKELSLILNSKSSEGWATFALDRLKEEDLTLKLSSINEIISKKGTVGAVNGLQIETELTHAELVKCIESQNDKDRQADLDAVMNLEE